MLSISKWATRNNTAGSRWKQVIAAASLSLGAALAAPVAQAGLVNFEGVSSGFLMDGDTFEHSGYLFSGAFVGAPGEGGGVVGAVVDGSDAGLCANFYCPLNNPSQYLGALNDGMLQMASSHGSFHIGGFDASYFGHDLNGEPPISGVLQLIGVLADGSQLNEYYGLESGLYGFQHYETSAAFAAGNFVSVLFAGYSCNWRGLCNAFNSNQGQFALDNISTVDVDVNLPEPGSYLLLGLGIVLMSTVLRRRAA